ncbi:hypothetical protein SiH_0329 [Sulfolobus islandicus HVE10/4]|uniref:Partial transposase in ISC1190 n=1 Tax=Saccharolobus islandicus (strain HVE10/4) TaxID=930943 RepID=F0NJA9_SACI0|nr:hypothetical protein SiH_0329 [Sulfolobus islandicus HVE10/4]
MEAPVVGIDLSKDKLIMYFQGKHYEFPNYRQGFEEIRKILHKGCKIGIESTGVYHINLAKYLMGEYDVRIVFIGKALNSIIPMNTYLNICYYFKIDSIDQQFRYKNIMIIDIVL